jgi:hypothetical protein
MVVMDRRPRDLDATRAAIAARDLIATASAYLTGEVAVHLEFEDLGPFKTLLKRYFSSEPWTDLDADELDGLVGSRLGDGWWEHDLGGGITLAHGRREGRYRLWVGGVSDPTVSIFDRAFDGPVIPETTPHPRKVRFAIGGDPAPGVWYRRSDPDPPGDERVKRLFAEPDVTDVMVAGDFVTVGISGSWERRLEPILALVTELFAAADSVAPPDRTREELIREASHLAVTARADDLHLLDPDDVGHRERLEQAASSQDARVRRVAVVVLAEASDPTVARTAVSAGYADGSRLVRRTAIDAAADREDEDLRDVFEQALTDADAWIRWRAVRALGELSVSVSREGIASLADDPEFRVRFEVARVLRRE